MKLKLCMCWFWQLSDRYNIFEPDWHNHVWRIPREDLRKENLHPAVKRGGGSMMVWGCTAVSGVGNLHFIEGIVNKHVYANTVWVRLIAIVEGRGRQDNFLLCRDCDPTQSILHVRSEGEACTVGQKALKLHLSYHT
jgi:hypothetical protein